MKPVESGFTTSVPSHTRPPPDVKSHTSTLARGLHHRALALLGLSPLNRRELAHELGPSGFHLTTNLMDCSTQVQERGREGTCTVADLLNRPDLLELGRTIPKRVGDLRRLVECRHSGSKQAENKARDNRGSSETEQLSTSSCTVDSEESSPLTRVVGAVRCESEVKATWKRLHRSSDLNPTQTVPFNSAASLPGGPSEHCIKTGARGWELICAQGRALLSWSHLHL